MLPNRPCPAIEPKWERAAKTCQNAHACACACARAGVRVCVCVCVRSDRMPCHHLFRFSAGGAGSFSESCANEDTRC